MTIKPSPVRTAIAFILLTVWTLCSISLFSLVWLFNRRLAARIPHLFHRGICRVFGLKVVETGEPIHQGPTLFVANHISYLDIFVLGGKLPGYFIAKSEVAGWPILGFLARFQNTLFFKRDPRHAMSQIDVMRQHLHNGQSLILFPEGTSTLGTDVLPFKSSLFNAADDPEAKVAIQPVTISYSRCRQQPMTAETRERFAWIIPMPFFSHFIAALGMGRCEVNVHYHAPVKLTDFESRKECAQHCGTQVRQQLSEILESTTTPGQWLGSTSS